MQYVINDPGTHFASSLSVNSPPLKETRMSGLWLSLLLIPLTTIDLIPLATIDAHLVGRSVRLTTNDGQTFTGVVNRNTNGDTFVIHSQGTTGGVVHVISHASVKELEFVRSVDRSQPAQPFSSAQMALELLFD